MRLAIIIGGGVVAVVLAGWLLRRFFFDGWSMPVTLTRGDILSRDLVIGVAVAISILVGALGRASLQSEREQRVAHDIESLRDRLDTRARLELTRTEVAGISQAQIRLAMPSNAERNRRNLVALRSCISSGQCRRLLTTIVVRTLSPRTTVRGRGTTRTIVIKGTPGPRGLRGLPGAPGRDGVGRQGVPGKPGGAGAVDSNVVDGLDNRLADVEQGLRGVVTRIEPLEALVRRLCQLLTPTKPC